MEAFSPDSTRLLTVQASGHVKVWSTAKWTLEADLSIAEASILTAVFAPDGKTILAGDVDGVIHEWGLEEKKEIRTLKASGAVKTIVFLPNGEEMATVHMPISNTESGSPWTATAVVFWSRDGKVVARNEGWSAVAISKDGKRMAVGGKHVEFLDPSSRKSIRRVELPSITLRQSNALLAMDPDTDAKTLDTKIPVSVVALDFSPDGATLAAGCEDGSIRLIQVSP